MKERSWKICDSMKERIFNLLRLKQNFENCKGRGGIFKEAVGRKVWKLQVQWSCRSNMPGKMQPNQFYPRCILIKLCKDEDIASWQQKQKIMKGSLFAWLHTFCRNLTGNRGALEWDCYCSGRKKNNKLPTGNTMCTKALLQKMKEW